MPSAGTPFAVAAVRLDNEHHPHQFIECWSQVRTGQAVPAPTAVGDSLDQAAPAQTREMVRHDLPRHSEHVSEVGWTTRRLAQGQQKAGASRI